MVMVEVGPYDMVSDGGDEGFALGPGLRGALPAHAAVEPHHAGPRETEMFHHEYL